MKQTCDYCGFGLVVDGPRKCCRAGVDYDRLLAEIKRLRPEIERLTAECERLRVENEMLKTEVARQQDVNVGNYTHARTITEDLFKTQAELTALREQAKVAEAVAEAAEVLVSPFDKDTKPLSEWAAEAARQARAVKDAISAYRAHRAKGAQEKGT